MTEDYVDMDENTLPRSSAAPSPHVSHSEDVSVGETYVNPLRAAKQSDQNDSDATYAQLARPPSGGAYGSDSNTYAQLARAGSSVEEEKEDDDDDDDDDAVNAYVEMGDRFVAHNEDVGVGEMYHNPLRAAGRK